VLGRITRGRDTDNPGGRHSIRTSQQSTSINPPIFELDALPVPTLSIYPGLGQEYAWIAYPRGLVTRPHGLVIEKLLGGVIFNINVYIP